ncbi:uncharacterized protein K444DRAFT_40729 [Hyaloscypha bicolor E]|uniref:Uncharacterized protein n=1 Tax=Hyaloscypha bicolor E TaxID=1095630 RepID=A0A2J6T1R7_9HELO|nr:uncharacterized protein K444DRAFT_40729 [Hyaloscypha bicolor E]PMD56959.1 hypothetical protein K444DRAFT_40729 [Hyaloscypha bicolor E]
MASEAPRSSRAGQGRQLKREGAASSLGTRQDKTRQHRPQKSNNAQRRKPDSSRRQTSREEWTVAESDAQDALVVSSEKEIGCGERDEQIQGQHSTARSLGAGRLNDHRTNYNTGARRVPYQGAESRCCCTAVSVLCESVFLCKQMRCASAIPFEFSLRRTFGGRVRRLEDWKTGSLEVRKEKTIRVTADKRATREQMIPNSQISPLNQCPASHSAFNHPFVCAEQSARTSGSKESLKRSQPPPPDHALIPSPFASKFRISVDFEGFFSFPCRMLCRDWPRSGADRHSPEFSH